MGPRAFCFFANRPEQCDPSLDEQRHPWCRSGGRAWFDTKPVTKRDPEGEAVFGFVRDSAAASAHSETTDEQPKLLYKPSGLG